MASGLQMPPSLHAWRRGGGIARALRTRAASASSEAHVPVLLPQVLSAFEGRRLHCYVDATLGAGGHAAAVLAAHPELRFFLGVDQDPAAHALAQPRVTAAAPPQASLHFLRSNFRHFATALASVSPPLPPLDGALFDLGMSSMQVDTAQRGFSFQRDGPIDMRMDPDAALSAEDVLNTWTEDELARILRDYGEERRWRALARRLVLERQQQPLRTTHQLAAAVTAVVGHPPRGRGGIHPATRTFQALRIAVNAELAVIEEALPACLSALAPGGRLAVISFHSLEDRIVKHLFRDAAGKAPPPDDVSFRGRSAREPPPAPPATVRLVTSKPLVAEEEEAQANGRARSAKLRVVEKLCHSIISNE